MAGKVLFYGPTEEKRLFMLTCRVQEDTTLGLVPSWLFVCSFPGSYYCYGEQTSCSFSFFHPSEYPPSPRPRHYAAKLVVPSHIVPAIGKLGHYRECRQRRSGSCLGVTFDGRTSGPSLSFRAYFVSLCTHVLCEDAAPVSVVFKSSVTLVFSSGVVPLTGSIFLPLNCGLKLLIGSELRFPFVKRHTYSVTINK
jgi:hypothetical protein